MRIRVTTKQRPATRLSVDFPKQGERISSARYTVRVSVPTRAKAVDLSIDQGPWVSCRNSVGHWWFDWSGYGSGEHEIVVRVILPQGEIVSSEPHEFFVDLGPHDGEANA